MIGAWRRVSAVVNAAMTAARLTPSGLHDPDR